MVKYVYAYSVLIGQIGIYVVNTEIFYIECYNIALGQACKDICMLCVNR